MLVFKVLKITVFWLILEVEMNNCFEPSNITRVLELNFESTNSAKRWRRVKENIHHIEDDHWQRNLKHAKQVSEYHPGWDSKISSYPKTWLYGRSKAGFSAKIFKDAQKPKKSQRSNLLKRPSKAI